jgi:hypothetical protein
MILPYEWIWENVEEEPMTIASKMISFRGERVFRVGLKNSFRFAHFISHGNQPKKNWNESERRNVPNSRY